MIRETRDISSTSGICSICDQECYGLYRTYFRYEYIKCECHSPYHFEIVEHCESCVPKEPKEIKVYFNTDRLNETFKDEIREGKIKTIIE